MYLFFCQAASFFWLCLPYDLLNFGILMCFSNISQVLICGHLAQTLPTERSCLSNTGGNSWALHYPTSFITSMKDILIKVENVIWGSQEGEVCVWSQVSGTVVFFSFLVGWQWKTHFLPSLSDDVDLVSQTFHHWRWKANFVSKTTVQKQNSNLQVVIIRKVRYLTLFSVSVSEIC